MSKSPHLFFLHSATSLARAGFSSLLRNPFNTEHPHAPLPKTPKTLLQHKCRRRLYKYSECLLFSFKLKYIVISVYFFLADFTNFVIIISFSYVFLIFPLFTDLTQKHHIFIFVIFYSFFLLQANSYALVTEFIKHFV